MKVLAQIISERQKGNVYCGMAAMAAGNKNLHLQSNDFTSNEQTHTMTKVELTVDFISSVHLDALCKPTGSRMSFHARYACKNVDYSLQWGLDQTS